jgi:hypothetical protein
VATKAGVQVTEDTTTHCPISFATLDNLNEATQVQRYDAVTVTAGVPQAPAANRLRAQTATAYDDQGRMYGTQVWSVNPSTGARRRRSTGPDIPPSGCAGNAANER